jgi:hypothetical protein
MAERNGRGGNYETNEIVGAQSCGKRGERSQEQLLL